MLILDTNIYVDVWQDSALFAQVEFIVEQSGAALGAHSVVVAELLAGGQGQGGRAALVHRFVRVAKGVVTPSHDDWTFAGNAVRVLGGDSVTTRRSLWNDLLIATSCARAGATLLTSNKSDFARIRRVVPVETISLRN